MGLFPDCFNANFGVNDFAISLVYNFVMWLAVVWVFHLAHPVFSGLLIWKSLKVFGLMLLFYLGVSAVYMNHYTDDLKPFYLYAMADGVLLFTLVGLANGLLYRFFFKPRLAHFDGPSQAQATPRQNRSRLPTPSRPVSQPELLSETSKLPTAAPPPAPDVPSGSGSKTDPDDPKTDSGGNASS